MTAPVLPVSAPTTNAAPAPSVTAPLVTRFSVAAWLVSVMVSPALPILIAPLSPAVPSWSVAAVIRFTNACERDSVFAAAADVPINSIGWVVVRGAKVTDPAGAAIPPGGDAARAT